jgi:anti-sigma B factor antagonist
MPPFLEIDEHRAGDALTLALVGELDLASADELVSRLSRGVHSGASVVLDLCGLAFIDPAGVGALRRAAAWAAQDGWTLAISGASENVQRVMRLIRADAVLPLRGA